MYFKELPWLLGLWWLASLESVRPSGNSGRISRLQSRGRIPSRENLFLALRLQLIIPGQPTRRIIAGVSHPLVCKHQSHLQTPAQQPGPHAPSQVNWTPPRAACAGALLGVLAAAQAEGEGRSQHRGHRGWVWRGVGRKTEIQSRLGRFDDTWCLMECGKNGNGKLKTTLKFLR